LTSKSDINEDDFNKLFLDFWHNKFNQSKLKNTKSELLDRVDIKNNDCKNQNIKTKYTKDNINNNIGRLGIVKDVLEILNIKSTVGNYKISRDSINELTEYYLEKLIIDDKEMTQREYIYYIFGIAEKDRRINELNFINTLKFTNLIFNNWNGSKIKGDENDKDRTGIYNSYITTNDFIIDFNNKIKIDINDLFNNENNEEIEEDEDQNIIEYKKYCFDDIDE
jgi:hypothetical protein